MERIELARRQVLEALGACGLVTVTGCVGSGADDGTTTTSMATPGTAAPSALRLATRLSFGPTTALLELASGGPDAYLADQLDPTAPESNETSSLFAAIDTRAEALLGEAEQGGDAAAPARRRASLETTALRTVAGAAWSARQLHALMVDFWSDHLHVSNVEQPEMFFVPSYDTEVIRNHALGSFSDMLVASARSAAMLTYLDQATSRSDGDNVPNENYARELMELHTVGVDGGYDEADVAEAAHILTGY